MESVMTLRFRAARHLALCASISCLGISWVHAEPATSFLRPELKVGEHLSDVFAKTVSTRGAGFEEKVDRISGTADYTVTRSEEHTSELQSLMRISYAVFCLKKKKLLALLRSSALDTTKHHKATQ